MSRLALVLVLALPAAGRAHPLGNSTVNRYAALAVGAREIRVHYVVDMAEIPAFQEIRTADRDGDGTLDPAERAAYLARVPAELARNLALTFDRRPLPLVVRERSLELPPGAGGLPTLRLDLALDTTVLSTVGAVKLRDGNFAGRAGWQEIVVDVGEGLGLAESTVPRTDRSRALRAYPADLLASPPQVTEASFRVTAATAASEAPAPAGATVGAGRFRDRMTELVATEQPLGIGLVLVSLLVAAGLGALHALGPGHGKTIVGAYLVGTRGTARHALLLGLVVTATHTIGVYVLGLVTLAASRWVVPERLFPWLGVASGLLVVGIGASLAMRRFAAVHDHAHDHVHEHDCGRHHHDHGHVHAHVPAGPLSVRSLVALGVSGGLLPCPSALVVMLGAIALGRVAFGLLLIVAFSAGLAAVLAGIGLAFVYARRWLDALPVHGRLVHWLPVASAVVVSLAGLLIVARSVAQMG